MRFKPLLRSLVLGTLVLVMIFQALILGLPALVQTLAETYLPPPLAGASLGFKIEKIGLFQALISQVSLGPDLTADLVQVDYRLKNFKEFHWERMVVYGLNLHVQMDADRQLFFNGAPFPVKKSGMGPGSDPAPVPTSGSTPIPTSGSGSNSTTGPAPALETPSESVPKDLTSLLGFLPDQIVVKNGFVSVTSLDRENPMPFELSSPLDLELLKTTDTHWTVALSRVHLPGPGMPWTQIKNFRASMELGPGTPMATGGFDLAGPLVPELGALFELKLNPASPGLAGFDSTGFDSTEFDLTLKNRRVEALHFGQAGFHTPALLFSLKGTPRQSSGQVEFACKDFRARAGGHSVSIKNINLNASVQADFSDKGKGMAFDLRATLSSMDLKSSQGRAGAESILVAGKAMVSKEFVPQVQVAAQLKNGTLDFPELNVAASHITAQIPLEYPFKKGGKSGTFSLPHLVYDQKWRAGFQGEIFQSQPREIKVSGLARLLDLPGLNLTLGATVGLAPDLYALVDFKTDPFLITPVHGKKIWPGLALSPESSLEFLSQGTLSFEDHGFKTRASVQVRKGNLFFPEMDLTLTGIAGAVEFADLVLLESMPGQEMTIDRIQADQFVFDRARLRFSIEDGRSLNIENLGFHWCNGIVSTEAFRLPPQDNRLRLILYCDRLELSQMLKQMGAFHAEGEGTLNGRIPMVYQEGNIAFDKGFLFSTPGKGGRVVIENSDKIIAGIPLNTPEFSQLDLAREALKDFEYTWAKLALNTVEDTLHVNMEMDGKPARVLPFEYKKEVNSFVRVDGSSPGSRFQGIRMDVNLTLPFNQVLKYGNTIKKIFE